MAPSQDLVLPGGSVVLSSGIVWVMLLAVIALAFGWACLCWGVQHAMQKLTQALKVEQELNAELARRLWMSEAASKSPATLHDLGELEVKSSRRGAPLRSQFDPFGIGGSMGPGPFMADPFPDEARAANSAT